LHDAPGVKRLQARQSDRASSKNIFKIGSYIFALSQEQSCRFVRYIKNCFAASLVCQNGWFGRVSVFATGVLLG
jgi:hypothetical protein